MTRILGAVLAGGRSSRFGSDKAAAIAPHVETVIRVGGDDGIRDVPRPGLGPLGGIAGALDHAARHGYDAALTIACDMPAIPGNVIAALSRRMPSYCLDAPVLGVWPVSVLGELVALLEGSAEDGPSIRFFARMIGAIPVEAAAPILNINTREDLLAL